MTKVQKVLDLKSTPCPLNIVKCKLALEKLASNEFLIIHLDKGEPEVMVKKTLIELNYCFKTMQEDEKTIELQISHDN